MPPVEVSYDEFTEDVEENRLVKAAAYALYSTKNLHPDMKLALKSIDSKLDAVKLVSYDRSNMPGKLE
jgi:5-methylcytosine-specific restriction enzyme subunit McrC